MTSDALTVDNAYQLSKHGYFCPKCHYSDGTKFGPIRRLCEMCDLGDLSPATPTSPGPSPWEDSPHPPPEAILPEDIDDQVPVHNSDGM